jgi:hypothetical protein
MCDDCGVRAATHKRPGDARLRWCGGCGAAHDGAVRSGRVACEGSEGNIYIVGPKFVPNVGTNFRPLIA